MNIKGVIFLFFILFTFSRCNPECRKDNTLVNNLYFSIIDSNQNDLIENGTYNLQDITLLDINGNTVSLGNLTFHQVGRPPFIGLNVRKSNKGLEELNGSNYYLHLNETDVDTIGLNVTEMINQCNNRYYESNSFSHNGVTIEESILSQEFETHYFIVE